MRTCKQLQPLTSSAGPRHCSRAYTLPMLCCENAGLAPGADIATRSCNDKKGKKYHIPESRRCTMGVDTVESLMLGDPNRRQVFSQLRSKPDLQQTSSSVSSTSTRVTNLWNFWHPLTSIHRCAGRWSGVKFACIHRRHVGTGHVSRSRGSGGPVHISQRMSETVFLTVVCVELRAGTAWHGLAEEVAA
ncbi:unnamed protein product [Pleuronectes platessa]|uniref:Uncharacterized protein n=1 Tax=Pleuronectes platessa TaxID=8262 RepID=A0A9N7YHE4_PLEPL|nr:unnamed protein product [Pleuronectes platessa]